MRRSSFKRYSFLCACLGFVMVTSQYTYAQDRIITAFELRQFYETMAAQEEAFLKLRRNEIRKPEAEQRADEIVSHFSDDAVLKVQYYAVHNQRLELVGNGKFTPKTYKDALLKTYEDPRNISIQVILDEVDLKGERAEVISKFYNTYDMVLDGLDEF